MKTQNTLSLIAIALLAASSVSATTIFETDFSSYSSGSLDGKAGWSFTNAGAHSWYIAEAGSTAPKKPSSLATHPDSLSGDNLFWIAARTENLGSTTNTAKLAFSDTLHEENLSLSFDIYVSPVASSSGSVFNFQLTDGNTSGPRIYLHGLGNAGGVGLRFTSGGTSVAILSSEKWYRIQLDVTPTTSTAGTWAIAVHELNASGSIVGSAVYSEKDRDYTATGFKTLQFQTVSNRADFWIDKISISTPTVPEPSTLAAILGASLLLVTIPLRLRRR